MYSAHQLTTWCQELLIGAGVPQTQAASVADVYWRATRRGLGHHDMSFLPQRLAWLVDGLVSSDCRPQAVFETGAAEVWDVGGSLGEAACVFALDRAMILARSQGLGYCAVRASNHFLAAAPYVEMGAQKGFFTLIWSNTDAGMAVPGGSSRMIGNNPLGWAFPTDTGVNLEADLCLASTSLGNLATLVSSGAQVPAHWGRDANGTPTNSAEALMAGGIEPIGGAKGFALALLGEMLTGLLADGTTLGQVATGGGLNTHNQMILCWDLEKFGGLVEAKARATHFRDQAACLGARIPGEQSQAKARQVETDGVELTASTIKSLTDWSLRLGVEARSQDC